MIFKTPPCLPIIAVQIAVQISRFIRSPRVVRGDGRRSFDAAVAANPEAHPLFHSDRGLQYTSRSFHIKLQAAKMKQSMSRVAHCIDNGPMEGFWGILKREMYYGRKFTSREQLIQAILDYSYFYNYQRLQRRLSVVPPMEFHEQYEKAA
jgi:transposase InsO family protein